LDFKWTKEHDAYRQRIKDVLKKHLPPDWAQKSLYDNGSDFTVAF
jgi:hypothetical protein